MSDNTNTTSQCVCDSTTRDHPIEYIRLAAFPNVVSTMKTHHDGRIRWKHHHDYVAHIHLNESRTDKVEVIASAMAVRINHILEKVTRTHPRADFKLVFKNAVALSDSLYLKEYLRLRSFNEQSTGLMREWVPDAITQSPNWLPLCFHIIEMGDRALLLKNCYVTLTVYT